MVMLFIHISLAAVTLVYAAGVTSASMRQKLERAHARTGSMWQGTFATVATGVLLTIMTGGSIGHLCGSLFAFLIVVGAAHAYQRNVRRRLYAMSVR